MNNRYKKLFKDLFLFALSTFLPAAISFFMVPLYTDKLTTAEYGLSDVLSTTVDLLLPFLTLNASGAVLRFTIEAKEDKRPMQMGYKFTALSSLLVAAGTTAVVTLGVVTVPKEYMVLFVMKFIFMEMYSMNVAYLRATDRVKLLATVSVVFTLTTVTANLLFLLVFEWGLFGFLLSSVTGYVVVDAIVAARVRLWKVLKGTKLSLDGYEKEMLAYSAPLVASGIAWWINTASDRYMVTWFCGTAANGIYSIAYKIPTILQMLQRIFSQAWTLSMYREYNQEGGREYVAQVHDLYSGAMILACSGLIFLDIPIAKILYADDFFAAWEFVPVLLISVVLIAESGFFGSLRDLNKQSKLSAAGTVAGATANIILNLLLIPAIGPMGAAIATAAGYGVMLLYGLKPTLKAYSFRFNWKKLTLMYGLLILEAVLMVTRQDYLLCAAIVVVLMLLNKESLLAVLEMFTKKLRKKA